MTEIRQLILLLIILPLGFAAVLVTRARAQAVDSNTMAPRRFALVIGNGDYLGDARLLHPTADAKAMTEVLRKERFDVTTVLNANEEEMGKAVQSFLAKLHPGDISLFYFSGHGMQIEGNNYLLPVNIKLGDDVYLIMSHSLQANVIAREIYSKTAGLKIIILDACRKNPFSTANGSPKGLVSMTFPGDGVIVYATAYGDAADDNDKKGETNSIFTKYLLRSMQEPGISLRDALSEISNAVSHDTNKKQIPHYDAASMEQFYFLPRAIDAAGNQPAQTVAHPREPALSTPYVQRDYDHPYSHRDYDHRVVPDDGLPHNEKEEPALTTASPVDRNDRGFYILRSEYAPAGTADYYAAKGWEAFSYRDGSDYAEAEKNFRKAVEVDPGVAFFRMSLATALYHQEKYAEAEAEDREALKLPLGEDLSAHWERDLEGKAHNLLGEILEGTEKYADAEAEYKKALEIDKKKGKELTFAIQENLRRLHSKMRRTPR